MYSHFEDEPALIKQTNYDRIDGLMKAGKYDPLPELRTRINREARGYRRNMVNIGFATGFLGSVVLGAGLSLTPILIGVIGGGSILIFTYKGFSHYAQVKQALKDDEIGDFLTDDELDDLDEYCKKFKPFNDNYQQVLDQIKGICDDQLEPEGDSEAIDVEAEPVSEKALDLTVKTPNNPPVDEAPDITNEMNVSAPSPWLKGAKVGEIQAHGQTVKKVTLREDGFIDKIDKEVSTSIKGQIGEELEEIRYVQGEQMSAINERIDNFEKAMLTAIESVKNPIAETTESRSPEKLSESAESIGVLGVAADSPHASLNNGADFALPPNEDGLKLNFGVFDPEQPEAKDEFMAYKWAVDYEGLTPKGNPILNRVWGVNSGGSKKCRAARIRRDQFASRLGEFGEFKLYGE